MSFHFTYNTFKSSLWLGFCHTGFTIIWRELLRTQKESMQPMQQKFKITLDKKLNLVSDPRAKNSAMQNPENLSILAHPLLHSKYWLTVLTAFPSRLKKIYLAIKGENSRTSLGSFLFLFSLYFCHKHRTIFEGLEFGFFLLPVPFQNLSSSCMEKKTSIHLTSHFFTPAQWQTENWSHGVTELTVSPLLIFHKMEVDKKNNNKQTK